jgi:hypothetical protein
MRRKSMTNNFEEDYQETMDLVSNKIEQYTSKKELFLYLEAVKSSLNYAIKTSKIMLKEHE